MPVVLFTEGMQRALATALLCLGLPVQATVLKFEAVGLTPATELRGLQSVKGYGDRVEGTSTGGFRDSFAEGNGWTPDVLIDFAGGHDVKTVNSWRENWDGGGGANYLLDGDDGGPYFYWYTFTPENGVGVLINSLDLNALKEVPNRVDWRICAGSRRGRELVKGSTGNFTGDLAGLNFRMKGAHYGPVVLELVHTGTRTSLAVDNLDFDQIDLGKEGVTARLVEVGTRKQLLVDDQVIDQMVHVDRVLGTVDKVSRENPVFEGSFYGTVLHDEGKFKLWYRGHPYGYAESRDGVRFHKVAALTGMTQKSPAEGATFYVDPHETDPAHRYKACYAHRTMRAALAYSADGIHWKDYNGGRPVTHRAADTYNQIVWDEGAGVYRLFTRTDYQSALKAGMEVRGTRSMINADPKADPAGWTVVRNWRFDREDPEEWRRRQIYGLTDWIYEGVHFALMMVMEWPEDMSEGPKDYHKRHERNLLEFYIATSRDGDSWDLHWVYEGKPMIPRGGDGAWDKDMIIPGSAVITHEDKHWLYYDGYNERHGVFRRNDEKARGGIGLATLRLDGFVGLEAKGHPGVITTKPFKLEGDHLQVNVQGEEFAVEVLDAGGDPLPGFSLREALRHQAVDQLRLKPAWRGGQEFSSLHGRIVRLRFHLKNAALYSFQALSASN